MKLSELLYRIEGELPEGGLPSDTSPVPVLIVTDDGRTYEPVQASADGELMVINARAVDAPKVYVVVWRDDNNEMQAQAYETREAAERDFPDSDIAELPTIIESTVQR